MKFKKGDKVIVKGLSLAFVVECYINDNEIKLFLEGQNYHTMHSIVTVRPEVLLMNNTENAIAEGWI